MIQETKLIPIEKAIWKLERYCSEVQLNASESAALVQWLQKMPCFDVGNERYVKLETLRDVLTNFKEYLKSGDPTALTTQRGFKSDRIVDVIEFLESKEFLANTLKAWNSTKDNMWQIWHGPEQGEFYPDGFKKTEILLTGSIRCAKSTTFICSYEYTLYLISQLWNPYAEYGLSVGRDLSLIVQSVNKDKAQKIIIDPLKVDLDASPYFQKHFPRNKKINTECRMPSGITVKPLTAEDTSALGDNIYSAGFTESNFMKTTKGSVKLRYSNKVEYHQAQELFNKARERQVGTFEINHPLFFGKIYTDSSVEHPGDFAHSKMEEAKTDPSILVINRAIWDAQPEERWPKDAPTFLVEVGDAHRASRIIETEEEAFNPEAVIRVPEKLRKVVEADTETALKNYAGIVTEVSGAFFQKSWVNRCQEEYEMLFGTDRLFKHEEISFFDLFGKRKHNEPVDWDLIFNWDYIEDCILDTQAPFAMRVDLSATEDATGFAICRINGFKFVEESTVYNAKTGRYEDAQDVYLPVFLVDGVIRIVARHGEEIDVELVDQMGHELHKHINTKWGLSDRAESSRAILQSWRRAQMTCAFMSVDTDMRPWMETKSAMRENRLIFPPHTVVDKEFKEARKVIKNGRPKIDHPDTSTGSKDCIDAIVGALHVLHLKQALYYIRQETDRTNVASRRIGTSAESRNPENQGRSDRLARRLRIAK